MAKAVNKQDKTGKGKATGKSAKGAGAKGNAKPARKGQNAKQPARASRASAPRERRGLGKFLHDVRIEMGKVTWPTRQDLMQSTLVVLVAVAIAAAYTFFLDEIFSQAVDFVVKQLT